MTSDITRTQERFVIGSYSLVGIGIARALSSCSEAAAVVAETDSAANQFGAPESVEDRAAHFRCLWPVSAPRLIFRISG